jgi:hypothetical protein
MQKPLPPLEQTDAPYLRELARPPELGVTDASPWPNRFVGLFIYASLFVFGWCIATGRLSMPRGIRFSRARAGAPAQPPRRKPMTTAPAASTSRRTIEIPRSLTAASARPAARQADVKPLISLASWRERLTAATKPAATAQAPLPAPSDPSAAALQLGLPEPLTKSQLIHFKSLDSFASWRELLTAARAGNRIARETLDNSPAHPSVNFALTAAEFKSGFASVRNVVLSRAWVDAILELLRTTERFDRELTIVTPFGAHKSLAIEAPIEVLNTMLGYEELPSEVRRQLELRRWILWHTRTDGQQHPEILGDFVADATPRASRACAGD